MKFKVLTLFPDLLESFKNHSIIKRGIENDKLSIDLVDYRRYATNKHHKVDDTPYGGGSGMLLSVQPIADAIKAERSEDSKVILVCPSGKPFKQDDANQLAQEKELIFVCGHYEGYDERIREYVDYEYSIGDYVLTSGEVASMVMMDAIGRLVDGVIDAKSHQDDSFQNNLLEYPQYTKPQVYEGLKVPEVLVNGHHAKIAEYRLNESIRKTLLRRPDLIAEHEYPLTVQKQIDKIRKDLE